MKNIKLYPSGKIIQCKDEDTILTALENHGLMLPNNCRAGACGECKVKVKSGRYDQGLILDMALSNSEREEGFGLMCMAKALDDQVEIEWGEVEAKPKVFEPEINKPFCVIDKKLITENVVKVELRALGKSIRFWPGQFIKLTDDKRKIKEALYSIGNTPNALGTIELYVEKTIESENNNWVHDVLSEGDTVYVSGAYGNFIGDSNIEKPVLCIAEGVGLAPIISLSHAAMIRGGFKKSATVIELAKNNNQVLGKGPLGFLDKKFRNFRYYICIENDLIHYMSNQNIVNLANYSIYIAGRSQFISETSSLLIENGASKELIFQENFSL